MSQRKNERSSPMRKTRPVYIMVSRTDTGIARLIRNVTHYDYNHVSLTLDPSFESWYSYARYAEDTPLWGGFIRETPARLLGKSGNTHVRIFRLDIPEKNALELENIFPLANRRDSGLIYNHFDAVACSLGIRVPVPGCHTCLSFACQTLGQEHTSIEQLCAALAPREIYEGSLAELLNAAPSQEDAYYSRMGLIRGSCHSASLIGLLVYRTLCHGFDSYRERFFRRTAL
jgi:hypothetical protein